MRVRIHKGYRRGMLTVIGAESVVMRGSRGGVSPHWLCRCECGVEKMVSGYSLTDPRNRSCGCFGRGATVRRSTRHGMFGSKVYHTWVAMIQRCHNPNNRNFPDYGGRGIFVCDEWRRSFDRFLADVGKPPTPKHSIGRINNGLGYGPSNCRWEDNIVQQNNRRNNRLVTAFGKTGTLAEMCREFGIPYDVAHKRIALGWKPERLLTTPVRKRLTHSRSARQALSPEPSSDLQTQP